MKIRIIQPYYSFAAEDIDACFEGMLSLIEECNEPLDIIVLPEYCDVPSAQKGGSGYFSAIAKYNEPILDAAKEMAKRCHAITFINCAHPYQGSYRNTTHVIDRDGKTVGRYYKAHPAPMEDKPQSIGGTGMDSSYSHQTEEPYTVEIEGLRFGFMTCYDFYMYEAFAPLARKKVDIIIGCSHQRTDPHSALSIINRFLAYNTNAYLIRASVSIGEDSAIGGGSCIIAPNGDVITDMKSRVGYETHEIDPHVKYYKAAGFHGRNAPKAHYDYIEDGRRPWLYRNGGKAIVEFERFTPYPRLCAHRGLGNVAPENSLPALSAAVSLGATEISLDLWKTKDGDIVLASDADLSLISNGEGYVFEKSYAELLYMDFGSRFSQDFIGLKIVRLEDALRKLASHAVMNLHLRSHPQNSHFSKEAFFKILLLLDRYDCRHHVYFTSNDETVLKMSAELCPDIPSCAEVERDPYGTLECALHYGCKKIQLSKEHLCPDIIQKAHDNGIRCNLCFADDPDEARAFLEMGCDTILTNRYLLMKNALDIQ